MKARKFLILPIPEKVSTSWKQNLSKVPVFLWIKHQMQELLEVAHFIPMADKQELF